MSENCGHDCEHCGEGSCADRKPANLKVEPNKDSKIKKVIAIVSGKGGVGKSLVTSLLLQNQHDPVVWRGPVISGAVKQFWTDVVWKDVDFMFVDMPPGTGDVPLTVFQSLPIDGIIVVSSPQQLVRVIVEKAVKMANMMNIPILGLIENMSYVKCPDCSKEIYVFGKSNIEGIAKTFDLPVLARIPMRPETSAHVDSGDIENLEVPELDAAADVIKKLL